MEIHWVPVGEEEPFDCLAKLGELNELLDEKVKSLEEGNSEVSQAVKDFKEIAGDLAA